MDILQNILLVIVSPRVGWETVNLQAVNPAHVFRRAYVPLLIVLALASFVPIVYDTTISFPRSLMEAVVNFSAYYFSVYIVNYMIGGFYPDLVKTRGACDRLKDYVIYSNIYLVLLEIVGNLLPIDFTPIFFMMLYVIWIAYRDLDYLGLAHGRRSRFLILTSAMLLLVPLIIHYLLSMLIRI